MEKCKHCGGEVIEVTYTHGDNVDGYSKCLDCGIVEG